MVRCILNHKGNRAYTLGADRQLIEWDAATGRQLRVLLRDASSGAPLMPYGALDVERSERLLAARNGHPVLIDLHSGVVIREFDGTGESIAAAAFHPDGKSFVAASGGKVFTWDTLGAGPRQLFPADDKLKAAELAYSKDGQRLLTHGGGSAVVWDTHSGKRLLSIPDDELSTAALSPDGLTLVIAPNFGKQVNLWDVASGKRKKELADPGAVLGFVAARFSPDGTTLVGVGTGPNVCMWDVESGRVLAHLTGHTANSVICLAFSEDGERLLTGDESGTALLFHAQAGTLQQRLEGRLAEGSQRRLLGGWSDAPAGRRRKPGTRGVGP